MKSLLFLLEVFKHALMALHVLSWLYTLLLLLSEGSYFLSPNPLTQPKAKQFCRDYCLSDLASIHNEMEWNRTIEIIKNSFNISSPPLFQTNINIKEFDVWIGLEGKSISHMAWTDGTSFDYGNKKGVYPWNVKEPNGGWNEQCVQAWSDQKYVWNDYECSHDMRFLCNSCVGKLSKYILIKQAMNNADAQTFCQTNAGTDLASLHSQSDYEEAKYLCQLTDGQSCWIGLTDAELENVWKWKDGTSLDFGSDISGGVYPWSNIPDPEPNNYGDEDCASLNQDKGYLINDEDCSSVQMYFFCNLPSELCTQSQWNVEGDLQWIDGKMCDVNSERKSYSILNNKKWVNGDNEWIIDYMFTVHNIHNTYGKAGILIYHFDSICDYYFVGISIDESGNVKVFIDKYFDNIRERLYKSNTLFTYEYIRYYSLRTKLVYNTDSIEWIVSIADEQISYLDTSSVVFINYSRRIGIKNENMNITAKSLFVSDTPFYESRNSISWNQCTPPPSTKPSSNPTSHPTINPTLIPTFILTSRLTDDSTSDPSQSPSLNPTKQPTFIPTVSTPQNSRSVTTSIQTSKRTLQPPVPSAHILTMTPTIDPTSPESENVIQTTSIDITKTNTENNDDLEVDDNNLWNTELLIIVMLLFCFVLAGTFGCILFIRNDSKNKNAILKQIMASHRKVSSESDEEIIQNSKVDVKVIEGGMTRFYVRAITDWESLEDDQLCFNEDEIICIVYTTKSGWWYAIDKQGNDGWIPSNYVTTLNNRDVEELKRPKSSHNDDEDVIIGLLTPQMDNSYNELQSKHFKFDKLPPAIPPVKVTMVTAGNIFDSSTDEDDYQTLGLNTSF